MASFYIPCVILLVVNYKIIKAFLGRSSNGSRSKKKNRNKKKGKVRSHFQHYTKASKRHAI